MEVNEEIVKVYFERQGYFTKTDVFYWKGKKAGNPNKSSGRGDIDILGYHPIKKKAIAVEVKGWQGEKFTKCYLKDKNLNRYFNSLGSIRKTGKNETGSNNVEVILVAPDYNGDFELAMEKKKVTLLSFKKILTELIEKTEENVPYHKETEQILRLLKIHKFLKE